MADALITEVTQFLFANFLGVLQSKARRKLAAR